MLMPISERGGGTNLWLFERTGPMRQLVQRLLDDLERLAHLLHADQVAGVHIAFGAGRDLEIVLLVAGVGPRLAQVPLDAAGAQHRAGHAEVQGILRRSDLADAQRPVEEERVAGQQGFVLVDPFRE